MKNNTFNYVLRRVLVFLVIAIITMLFNACNVHAESYPIENYNTRLRFMPNDTYINNANWNQNYWNGTPYDKYKGFDVKANLVSTSQNPELFEGRYLISFLVWSNQNDPSELYCGHLTSNFKNVNKTTGNWVQNEIMSSCVDVYHVTYLGKPAWRILYEFTYKEIHGWAPGIDEFEFIVNSERNFFNGDSIGLDAGITVSDIMDYDLNIINTWNTDKSQQTIINGQQDIINNQTNNTNSIIYNQNNNTQDIINSQEELNQELIDNQNENTQDIIDNQNSNTDKQIESQKVCTFYDKNNISIDNKYLNSVGSYISSNNFGVTDFISITSADIIVVLTRTGSGNACFYSNQNDNSLISCISNSNMTLNEQLTIPVNANYVKFTIQKIDNAPNFNVCKNGNQALTDSLTDNSVDSPSDDFESFQNMLAQNGVITQLITLPISLFTNILNSINGTCSPFNLGDLMGTTLTIPCINISNFLGSFLWNVIDILFSGIFVYTISKKMIKVFENMTSLKESDDLE